MPGGRRPEPGGWDRFRLEVDDLAGLVDRLRQDGAHFCNEQILLEDPSGNAIELFEPHKG
jgi:catechol 2,3-dioxygenase-like lactoylglutathione lyase family enzyme